MKRGFTLVELLTTIAIFAIAAAFGVATLGQVRARARDDARIADLKRIQTALEQYRIDLDRSGNPEGKYAYPPLFQASGTPGIYGDSQFAKYMTSTPTDPLQKRNYIYAAPACVRPGQGTAAQPMVVTLARDGKFHTASELKQKTAGDPSNPCPQGSGWVPYAVYVLLERGKVSDVAKQGLANLVDSNQAVVYSVSRPLYVLNDENSLQFVTVSGYSYCYPATATCPNGYTDQVGSQPSPSPQPTLPGGNSTINSPSPQPSPSSSYQSSPSFGYPNSLGY